MHDDAALISEIIQEHSDWLLKLRRDPEYSSEEYIDRQLQIMSLIVYHTQRMGREIQSNHEMVSEAVRKALEETGGRLQ